MPIDLTRRPATLSDAVILKLIRSKHHQAYAEKVRRSRPAAAPPADRTDPSRTAPRRR